MTESTESNHNNLSSRWIGNQASDAYLAGLKALKEQYGEKEVQADWEQTRQSAAERGVIAGFIDDEKHPPYQHHLNALCALLDIVNVAEQNAGGGVRPFVAVSALQNLLAYAEEKDALPSVATFVSDHQEMLQAEINDEVERMRESLLRIKWDDAMGDIAKALDADMAEQSTVVGTGQHVGRLLDTREDGPASLVSVEQNHLTLVTTEVEWRALEIVAEMHNTPGLKTAVQRAMKSVEGPKLG